LSAAFLPQYFQKLAVDAGVNVDISTLFSIYYATYALALPLTGGMVEKKGPKPFLLVGAGFIVTALLLLSFVPNFYVLFLIQVISGLGEGMFFIAVQSYVLSVASAGQRTKGAAIIVNSLYGGLLSGTAIGALLVADPEVAQRGVFILGSIIAIFALLYVVMLIPRITKEDFSETDADLEASDDATLTITHQFSRDSLKASLEDAEARAGIGSRLLRAFTDIEFVATAILIGIPVKIILAGLFKASLPLVLTRYNYPTEDVGQIMMLYSGGVLLSSAFISRITDRIGKTSAVLFIGAVGSGLGLVLMGLIGWDTIVQSGAIYVATATLLFGISLLGLAHGFIQAPIITHVANTNTADRFGKGSATSLYRLFERIGNIGGPLLVGALLVQSNYNAFTISWIGMGVILFGLLFYVGFKKG
jgi:MFS family permease